MNIFHVLFYEPIYNTIIIFYRLLSDNLGLSIIAVALIARVIMIPLSIKQMQMAESGKIFSEKLKAVKEKHKNNKEVQQKEMMKLQSEYLPSQLAGCLPIIFQFIFFINIYNVIRNLINEGAEGFNKVAYSFVDKFPADYSINSSFFGIVDLKTSASKIGLSNTDVLPYLILILLVGTTQFFSMKMMMAKRKTEDKPKKKSKKGKDKQPEDFSEIIQQSTRQTMFMMPLLIMFISYSLPAGLSLYWISQSTFVIIQQFIFNRYKANKLNRAVEESK